jgi:hypothetical protein
MKTLMRVTWGCVLLLAQCAICGGQHVAGPIEVTLCDLYQHPEQYAGKMVKVRGAVGRNDLSLDDFSETCPAYMRVIVVYPNRIKPSPGFELIRDKSFKQLEDAIYQQGPVHIDATFEGRFDAAFYWRDHKRIAVGQGQLKGYGKKHNYDGQIVLHQVSDVAAFSLPRL